MQCTGYILFVDDDAAIVELVVDVLTDEGYLVLGASDAAQALETMRTHPPALLILDLRMPDMTGTELLLRVQALGLSNLSIVVMTASPNDAVPLAAQGMSECLAKPFAIDDLLACVARHVHLRDDAARPSGSCLAPVRGTPGQEKHPMQ